MREDPRLLEWLELAQNTLETDEKLWPSELAELAEARDRLELSLREEPPTAAPSSELAQRLLVAERKLEALTRTARDEFQEKIGQLRRVRSATTGYRPARGDVPAFLSRSI